MKAEIEDFQTGWYGLSLGINKNDVDNLIERLIYIKNNSNEHFHISSNYDGEGGVGDIEFYILDENEEDNMIIQP